MDQKKISLMILRHLSYSVILLICYILQTVPRLLDFMGTRPNIIIPVIVAIAMYEGEYAGGLYGAFGGMLWDIGASTLFGIGGIILLVAGVTIGLLIIYLIQNTKLAAYTMTFSAAAVHGTLTYVFIYGMWGFENAQLMFWQKTVPSILYTTALSGLIYMIIGRVHGYFEEQVGE